MPREKPGDFKVVVSLSRRTEPYFHAARLGELLLTRYPPPRVHTVVVWTKFPEAVLVGLRPALAAYEHVYVHLTVTGLGGTFLEPRVPPPQKVLAQIPALLDFLGDPRRLRIRPDPLVRFKRGGEVIANVGAVAEIIARAASLGVKSFSTSFVELYPKVRRRLAAANLGAVPFLPAEKERIIAELSLVAEKYGAALYTCCVPGLPTSRCIDGELLSALHPRRERCCTDKARGQRPLCGCTHAVDLGWYSMTCPAGCLYCYASGLKPHQGKTREGRQ